jgi:WD40 repeat protein
MTRLTGIFASGFLATAAATVVVVSGQTIDLKGNRVSYCSYEAAVYSSGVPGRGGQNLILFPPVGKPLQIGIPVALGRLAYSPDGTSIYAGAAGESDPRGRLVQVQILPTQSHYLPESANIGELHSIASDGRDLILFSGSYGPVGSRSCGMFLLRLREKVVSKVLDDQSDGCRFVSGWLAVSLSPDGHRGTAVHNGDLVVFDLPSGNSRVLGRGFERASWSQDGKWLAALVVGNNETVVLFDAETLMRRRTLKSSGVAWSPDSKYLLGQTSRGCGLLSYAGSLEKIEVSSGKRMVIATSRCQVNRATYGWVCFNPVQ